MGRLLRESDLASDRPYERCLRYGPKVLTDAQLLAVVLRTGTVGKDAVALAEEILSAGGVHSGLLALCHMTVEQLTAIPGVGEVKAIQLQCVAELSQRIAAKRALRSLSFSEPSTIADYYMELLRHCERECLHAMMLDTKGNLLHECRLSEGTVNSALLSVRELFAEAVRHGAVGIVLVHNHPSGDPTPSREDIEVTMKVREAGRLLEISLLDHIVIGDCCYVSFLEEGLLRQKGG